MKQGKRMQDVWEWTASQELESKFGGGPKTHPKVENRIPTYVIDSSETENEVYFINNSKERLTQVISSLIGDWPEKESDRRFSYFNVLPGEMVKIDDFDPIYDYKEMIQQDVCIEYESGKRVRFYCHSYGGIIGQTVLLWENQDIGKGVNMIHLESNSNDI